jgi:hypothetical protein
MMVAVVRRAIRTTQPPVTERRAKTQRAQGLMLEDHYALLLAAGY